MPTVKIANYLRQAEEAAAYHQKVMAKLYELQRLYPDEVTVVHDSIAVSDRGPHAQEIAEALRGLFHEPSETK
jgi:hypothetical protein